MSSAQSPRKEVKVAEPLLTEEPKVDPISICRAAAFPFQLPLDGGGVAYTHGLSKRELFAAMAMQGAIASGQLRGPGECISYALQCADALLKELAK